jgi:hypothetical protein
VPALSGQIIITLRDDVGDPLLVITENFNPTTFAMVNANVTTSTGVENGAVVVDNLTGSNQRMAVFDPSGTELKSFNINRNGEQVTAAQLAAVGVNVIQDLNGLSPVVT